MKFEGKTLLNFGVDPSTNITIIPRSVFDAMTTACAIPDGKPGQFLTGHGMSWIRLTYEGYDVSLILKFPNQHVGLNADQVIAHDGAIPGFSAVVLFFPNEGFGVTVLINGDYQGEANNNLSLAPK
jgi:hypothetical protein